MQANDIGNTLRELRESRKMTQRVLAKDLSVAPSTISNWEKGRRQPSLSELRRIAEYFDVSLADFDIKLAQVITPEEEDALLKGNQIIEVYPSCSAFNAVDRSIFMVGILVVLFSLLFRSALMFMPLVAGTAAMSWMVSRYIIRRVHQVRTHVYKVFIPKTHTVQYRHPMQDVHIAKKRRIMTFLSLLGMVSIILFYVLALLVLFALDTGILVIIVVLYAVLALNSAFNRFVAYRKNYLFTKEIPYYQSVRMMHHYSLMTSWLLDAVAYLGYVTIVVIFYPSLEQPVLMFITGIVAFFNLLLAHIMIDAYYAFSHQYVLCSTDEQGNTQVIMP